MAVNLEDLQAQVTKLEETNTTTTEKLEAAETARDQANAKVTRLEAVDSLTTKDRDLFKSWGEEEQGLYLKADKDGRSKLLTDARKAAEEAIRKAAEVPEAVQKQMDDLTKRAEDAEAKASGAEKIAREERDLRELASIEKRVGDEFSHLPTTTEEKAKVFKTLRAKLTAEEVEKVEALFKAGEEAISQLGKGTGSDAAAATDGAWGQIEKRAQTISKERNITVAEATDEFLRSADGQALYNEYLKESAQQ